MHRATQLFVDLDWLEQTWQQFTTSGQFASNLHPLVVQSWQRCAPRLNPNAFPQKATLNESILALTLRQHQAFIAVARPVIEDVYQYLEGTGVMLALVDSTACLIDSLGDEETVTAMRQLGVQHGAFLHESRLGTIAFSSALIESTPTQVTGAEHFSKHLHGLHTVAAPIFALAGHALGAVGLLTHASNYNHFGVSLMFAVARAIENQLTADTFTTEANARATELNLALDASSDAILVWDAKGVVTHLNYQAGKLLEISPASVMGHALSEILVLPSPIAQAVTQAQTLTDVEVTLVRNGKPLVCLASLRVLHAVVEGESSHYIVTFKRIEQVHQLVNRLVGAQARLTLDDLVSQSPASQRVRRQALTAADAKACILIQGEPGTGKNALARAIHNSSKRASGPFLSINCRAIPRDLVLGEFLGYEAGSFHSPSGQPSKFELANGGTLFLDEVDALPLDVQSALLRVIEAGDVIRLSGNRVIQIDVRVIAASHAPLEERVREGSFRADLLFRLSSFVVSLPPLRESQEDIPVLIERLLARLKVQLNLAVRLTSEARAMLLAYPWPGNIRELESVLERAALACEGEPIAPGHLPSAVREKRAVVRTKTGPLAEPVRSMVEVERQAILSAFRASRGNMTQAASLLGIGRTTLWRKIKEHNITTEELLVN
jgi:transcriptional activator for dhaKLM operon